ncbi:MAG: hypothetical protein V7749_00490 [Cocleimonas sp.]
MQNIVFDNLLVMAIIKALGNILTAAVPSVVTYIIGKKLVKNRRLQKRLDIALTDLKFLLMVEQFHCREHTITAGKSNKLTIRNCVKQESDCVWSGKNTLSRIERSISSEFDSKIIQMDKLVRPARMKSRY